MSYLDRLTNKVYNHVLTNYEKVDNDNFKLGEINYTYRCHLNAVQKAYEHKHEVYLCIAIHKYDKIPKPIIHFINKQDNKYIDNTWGWLYEEYNYYIIRKVDVTEYCTISELLSVTRDSLLDLYSNSRIRKIILRNNLVI